jgi:hypothetical protein
MLRSAMGKTAKPLPLGLYILQAPSDEWCPALKHAVRDVCLGSQGRGRERRMVGSGLPQVRVFELPSTADRKQAEQLTPSVQEALAPDQTVIVIAGNLANIPTALQQASDRIFTVPAPRRQFVSALIRQLVPTARRLAFRGLACEALTPSLLRLAYRRNTSANAFLRRLRAMTSPALGSGAGKTIPLDRLHGVDEAKRWAMDLRADVTRYRQGQLAWQELSHGLLLAGAPGADAPLKGPAGCRVQDQDGADASPQKSRRPEAPPSGLRPCNAAKLSSRSTFTQWASINPPAIRPPQN